MRSPKESCQRPRKCAKSEEKTLTNKEVCHLMRWQPRTWLRYRARYKVRPVACWGRWPLFAVKDVLAMENRRFEEIQKLNSRVNGQMNQARLKNKPAPLRG